ncbi:MAG: hypothetical protein FGM47_04870 [Candidatus Nanopelagicaceae bacterium]|nr:hypothetical protein [Candidatus Nanopelagicaceae bacterium]
MSNLETFRPRSGYVMGFSAFFAISALVYINIIDYGLSAALSSLIWGVFASALFYLIFIHPKVVFFDEGVLIVNPLQSFKIGWHEVSEIDARYTMYVIHSTSGRKIHAFAAQAPGRYHSRTVHPNEVKGMRVSESGMIRAGESPRSNSGVATAIARSKFEQFKRFNQAGVVEFETNFNNRAALIVAALFFTAIVAQIIHS